MSYEEQMHAFYPFEGYNLYFRSLYLFLCNLEFQHWNIMSYYNNSLNLGIYCKSVYFCWWLSTVFFSLASNISISIKYVDA